MLSTQKISLDDDKKFILMKFRHDVSDVLESHHDDYFLLRWLKARSWNVDAAEKMLRQSLKWRQQWEVDGALKTWILPKPLELYNTLGTCGYDKYDCPVIIILIGILDINGLLQSVTRQEYYKFIVRTLETNLVLAKEAGSNQLTVIFDLEGFQLRNYTSRRVLDITISLIQMYEANYPEVLKACYIINAPKAFAIMFAIIKKFLNDFTLSKIEIYQNDPNKWKPALLKNIDPDNLPKCFGGNLVDPDGNPKYTTKINQGGKVPKSYYLENIEPSEDEHTKEYTSVLIKNGDKLQLDFIIAEDESILNWDFHTEDHDIRFGISMKDVDGNNNVVIPPKRVAAYQNNEIGMIKCQPLATYTVTFDNSYSLLRSKKLHYNVHVTVPPNN